MATLAFRQPVTATVKYLKVQAGVRYWEDAKVNGQDDADGELIPFRFGDMWCPTIDVDTGSIIGWPKGTTASIHYKVCDEGIYTLYNEADEEVRKIDGYVPSIMSPGGNGYGDYIIMEIGGDGRIKDWVIDLEAFECDEDD